MTRKHSSNCKPHTETWWKDSALIYELSFTARSPLSVSALVNIITAVVFVINVLIISFFVSDWTSLCAHIPGYRAVQSHTRLPYIYLKTIYFLWVSAWVYHTVCVRWMSDQGKGDAHPCLVAESVITGFSQRAREKQKNKGPEGEILWWGPW